MELNIINKVIMTSSPLLFAMSAPLYSANIQKNSTLSNSFIPHAIQYSQPLNYKRFQQRLGQIFSLSNNWNGEGAVAIDLSVYMNANDFLSKLDGKILESLKDEDILPTPYGTITLDFEKGNELVSVEIGENKLGFFTDFATFENFKSDGFDFPTKYIHENLKQSLVHLWA